MKLTKQMLHEMIRGELSTPTDINQLDESIFGDIWNKLKKGTAKLGPVIDGFVDNLKMTLGAENIKLEPEEIVAAKKKLTLLMAHLEDIHHGMTKR